MILQNCKLNVKRILTFLSTSLSALSLSRATGAKASPECTTTSLSTLQSGMNHHLLVLLLNFCNLHFKGLVKERAIQSEGLVFAALATHVDAVERFLQKQKEVLNLTIGLRRIFTLQWRVATAYPFTTPATLRCLDLNSTY
jgi:hypothetical protein